ncbi:MAG: hypothetical protein R3E58_14270 [Phycisphaerae bacterium]
MPTLQERVGDIPLLANHFLDKFCEESNRTITGFSEQSCQRHAALPLAR